MIPNDELAPSPVASLPAAGEASPADRPVVLALRGISKRYGPVKANQDITIEFRSGEIHALLGENGSGKSTLLGIASGTNQADEGTVEIAGELLGTASPKRAMELGLGMAYQTMSEVAGLTVAENLYLAAPPASSPELRADGAVGGERCRATTNSTSTPTRPPSRCR